MTHYGSHHLFDSIHFSASIIHDLLRTSALEFDCCMTILDFFIDVVKCWSTPSSLELRDYSSDTVLNLVDCSELGRQVWCQFTDLKEMGPVGLELYRTSGY